MTNPNLHSVVNDANSMKSILGAAVRVSELLAINNKYLTNAIIMFPATYSIMELGNNSFGDFALGLLQGRFDI